MKKFLRNLVPGSLLAAYRRFKRQREHALNARRSTEEVFSEIYAENRWGGQEGDYCSGLGTIDMDIADAYVNCLTDLADELEFGSLKVVDLGCGDMRIGQRIMPLFAHYTGVDIVKGLIEQNAEKFGGQTANFVHLDIIEEDLPEGDVCLVRQVLQHLSNDQIRRILPKLRAYRYVIVTEHLPTAGPDVRVNVDKPHGGSIRIHENSGVFLADPPFNVPGESVKVLLEVPGHGFEGLPDAGVIQTILISNPDR